MEPPAQDWASAGDGAAAEASCVPERRRKSAAREDEGRFMRLSFRSAGAGPVTLVRPVMLVQADESMVGEAGAQQQCGLSEMGNDKRHAADVTCEAEIRAFGAGSSGFAFTRREYRETEDRDG